MCARFASSSLEVCGKLFSFYELNVVVVAVGEVYSVHGLCGWLIPVTVCGSIYFLGGSSKSGCL